MVNRNVQLKSPETIERYLQVKIKVDSLFIQLTSLFDSYRKADPSRTEEYSRMEMECKEMVLRKATEYMVSHR